jgi:hypothetical protein
MDVDIRLPIGSMFSIFGLMLVLFGLFTNASDTLYTRSLGINVNLWTGLLMLVFGGLMLLFALKKKREGHDS